jgi:AcrR family transcriptional regulator
VADVARAADVSEGTVFNYFGTKEDLFYGQMETSEAALLEAVRDRELGESVLSAFRRLVLERSAGLAGGERAELIATAARLMRDSPALQAREREIVAGYTRSLAALIAEELGANDLDVEPMVAASALMGAQSSLRDLVHARVLAGEHGPKLADEVRAQAEHAFGRLEAGLADYAIKSR